MEERLKHVGWNNDTTVSLSSSPKREYESNTFFKNEKSDRRGRRKHENRPIHLWDQTAPVWMGLYGVHAHSLCLEIICGKTTTPQLRIIRIRTPVTTKLLCMSAALMICSQQRGLFQRLFSPTSRHVARCTFCDLLQSCSFWSSSWAHTMDVRDNDSLVVRDML